MAVCREADDRRDCGAARMAARRTGHISYTEFLAGVMDLRNMSPEDAWGMHRAASVAWRDGCWTH